VYVTDTGNGRVVVFSPEGEVAATWGTKGSGGGEFQDPIGIAAGGSRIYVADAGNRRIVVLDRHGETLAAWPVDGWKDQVYREPYLALLPDGSLAATDPPGDRVLFFDAKGAITGERRLDEGANPSGIAVGRAGKLIVGELKLDRLVEVAPAP
jgi:DNA-binding beta-propeller fold protein YncE